MGKCGSCEHAQHEQFKGYKGRWLCGHPCRVEIDNRGRFTYPENYNPTVVICETPAGDFGNNKAHLNVLSAAKTPVWCYYTAVERAKRIQPRFDPDVQRRILWPERSAAVQKLLAMEKST